MMLFKRNMDRFFGFGVQDFFINYWGKILNFRCETCGCEVHVTFFLRVQGCTLKHFIFTIYINHALNFLPALQVNNPQEQKVSTDIHVVKSVATASSPNVL